MMLDINKIYNDDCFNLFSKIDDNSVDLIVTDPPYKTIGGGSKRTSRTPSGMLTGNRQNIFEDRIPEIEEYIYELYRVLKPKTSIYLFTNFYNLEHFMSAMRKAGFKLSNLLVWDKNTCTPSQYYMKNVEYIIYGYKKNQRPIHNCGSKVCTRVPSVHKDIKTHITEKPVDLLKLYIGNSSDEGEVVFDPFCGTASFAEACINLNRNYIGIEKNSINYIKAIKRLSKIGDTDCARY